MKRSCLSDGGLALLTSVITISIVGLVIIMCYNGYENAAIGLVVLSAVIVGFIREMVK